MAPVDPIAFFRQNLLPLFLLVACAEACGNSAGGASPVIDASGGAAVSKDGSSGDASDADLSACPSQLPSDSNCADTAPSYDGVVAPIIVSRCTACHSPTGVEAGTLFDTYARIKANMMQVHLFTQVYYCLMPPPGAPPLTGSERETLLQWFVCDAPRGDASPGSDETAADGAPDDADGSAADGASPGDDASSE
jgi:hypothetical protein